MSKTAREKVTRINCGVVAAAYERRRPVPTRPPAALKARRCSRVPVLEPPAGAHGSALVGVGDTGPSRTQLAARWCATISCTCSAERRDVATAYSNRLRSSRPRKSIWRRRSNLTSEHEWELCSGVCIWFPMRRSAARNLPHEHASGQGGSTCATLRFCLPSRTGDPQSVRAGREEPGCALARPARLRENRGYATIVVFLLPNAQSFSEDLGSPLRTNENLELAEMGACRRASRRSRPARLRHASYLGARRERKQRQRSRGQQVCTTATQGGSQVAFRSSAISTPNAQYARLRQFEPIRTEARGSLCGAQQVCLAETEHRIPVNFANTLPSTRAAAGCRP